MLKKRIIPCLDVKDGNVVKGIQFRDHEIVGDIISLAKFYSDSGADELVFYDITASSSQRSVDKDWVYKVAKNINIPFCVAGGIRDVESAAVVLANGADKISINSPALENPQLIAMLAKRFGSQAVVVGIDSMCIDNEYIVYQYTGDMHKSRASAYKLQDWAKQIEELGAGEIVLNCMNKDGVRSGYDIDQCKLLSELVSVPVVASGGAGSMEDFFKVFTQTKVTGALAASVFHKCIIGIGDLKAYLADKKVSVRLC